MTLSSTLASTRRSDSRPDSTSAAAASTWALTAAGVERLVTERVPTALEVLPSPTFALLSTSPDTAAPRRDRSGGSRAGLNDAFVSARWVARWPCRVGLVW
jgi:hypothetical protein